MKSYDKQRLINSVNTAKSLEDLRQCLLNILNYTETDEEQFKRLCKEFEQKEIRELRKRGINRW